MKKIFTVLVALGGFVFANAQSRSGDLYQRNDNRNNTISRNDDRRFDNAYSFTARERDEQIARLNAVYDAKINDIRMERFVRENKRRKEIARLDFERSEKLRDINARFFDGRNRFSDAYAYGNSNRRH